MAHSEEVQRADKRRRKGKSTWEEYRVELQGKFVPSAGEMFNEIARGVRDRHGRLKDLEDLGGKD